MGKPEEHRDNRPEAVEYQKMGKICNVVRGSKVLVVGARHAELTWPC
jgi:hypothetical protein